MPGYQRTRFVNEHRVGEAKFADRGSDLRYLLVRMRAGIAGVGDEPIDRPALDLIGRPRPLISASLARVRAAARDGGSVGVAWYLNDFFCERELRHTSRPSP
jgi:hypothetical protein